MPAEVSSASAVVALAALAVALVFLPLVLLIVAPVFLLRSALKPRAPAYRRGGYYEIR